MKSSPAHRVSDVTPNVSATVTNRVMLERLVIPSSRWSIREIMLGFHLFKILFRVKEM
jgi:hypothetical protein